MSWLTKISKLVKIIDIPFQIHASLINITDQQWNMDRRQKVRENVFSSSYSLKFPPILWSGNIYQVIYDLVVFWEILSDHNMYDSNNGLDGLKFECILKKKSIQRKSEDSWIHYHDPEYFTSSLLYTPYELSKWVDSIIDKNSGFDFNDNDPNDNDNPDLFPQWPYNESDYIDSEKEYTNIRNPRIRGKIAHLNKRIMDITDILEYF